MCSVMRWSGRRNSQRRKGDGLILGSVQISKSLPVNVNSDFVKSMYDMLTQFATGGIKILLMINGGAAVAVLAFLGNLVGKTNMDVSMMIRPLGLY